jgi:A/G-specific adenine glycosylase
MARRSDSFSRRLLAWYDRHGRHDLPWQGTRDPYRIWVSEIMLQQTQVATVIPYYECFLKRFPDVRALARARVDSVLHLWTGLGYYARARHLHEAARRIVRAHGGRFPRTLEAVASLPGIGRSTAGAILAFAHGQRHAILDGNVKRVLARYHALDTPLPAAGELLWRLAEQHTPRVRVRDYTQAIMDLGATVCRRRPDCAACPLARDCRARRLGRPQDFPVAGKTRAMPTRRVNMLILRDARGRVLLVRRPPAGVWGGLWSLPESVDDDLRAFARDTFGLDIRPRKPWPVRRHTFSHFRLDITPIPARLSGTSSVAMENGETLWYNPARPAALGLAAPVKQLLERLKTEKA